MTGGVWAADWRVYLHLPAADPPADMETALADALGTGAVGAVELPLGGLADTDAAAAVDRFRQIVQPTGIPLLAQGEAPRAVLRRLDGIRLMEAGAIEGARRALGPEAQIGVTLGENRDEAMRAGERGADFVYLTGGADFVGWWAELMVVPCVAAGGDRLADAAAMLARMPDMVALGDAAWNHPDGPSGAIKALAGLAAA